MTATGIGAPVRRKEDFRFITGQGQYTDDVTRPGETRAVFVRSPHAHAKIKKIDVSAAKKMPGVIDVLTGAQLADDKVGNLICGWMIHSKDGSPMKMAAHPALAASKVNCVGDAVAVVIAETTGHAKDAAEKVVVDYEVLPAVVDPAKAQAKGAPQIHADISNNTIYQWHLGEQKAVEAAFKAAKHITKLDIVNNRLAPNAMEPRAALADYDAGNDHLTLWNTSQNPHVARLVISAFVGITPEHKLRVIAPDVGGGFGSKIFIYPEEVVCLWAARKVRRPVKWTSDRTEAFLTDAHGRDHITHAELALDGDGKILALRAKTIANLGAYMSTFSSSIPTYLYATLLSGQYDIPQIYCEVDAVYTNTVPVDAYRGAGRPEATFVVERLVEVAARQLGLDPAEFRKRNFIKSFPHQTPVIMTYDAGDYNASLKKAMELADVKGFAKRKRDSARQGKLRGLGYSTYIEACGIAPSQAVGSLGAGVGLWESAEVRVNPTGNVEVLTGSHAHGQGHETTFAQLVSERLGIPFDSVSIVHGDTDKVQFGMGTYGSRSGAVGMSAIVKALDKIEAKAKKVAGFMMEAAESDIDFKDGKFTVKGTDKSVAFGDVALNAYIAHKFTGAELEPGLKETSFYDPTNFTFPAGCHICEVEIDQETGKTDIVNWTAVDDFGTVINPMIVEGQVHGGIAQGVGQALLEGVVYDSSGQLVTASFMDYSMPHAHDLPSFKVGLTETKSPSNPLGMKGCGEAGAIAAPAAVINAITDALGTEDIAMPATPNAVWTVMQRTTPKAA
ncbi:xanthine dehydrogenase family protein molybdopterin-binding subunit [Undibacter mobilis]|uniref:Xanthine dehydrogenase family protein molybdopterin-binding subunit n=1 Tax=Undibacter mobilis TaxID=2292256 RepID=A0A371BD03_9BRAD|nr:xanthine dehydrogenase family protein molybdopterin-binding subunit [Undibacter mobilis]RDV05283.1 xanthine dehydrogenase family protein molybdopterin-binding subunit [Undibacter mobilis]